MLPDENLFLRGLIYVRGQEIAKLAMKVHRLRLKLREVNGPVRTSIADARILSEDLNRQNAILKDQNRKLVIENRELRLLIITRGSIV